MIWGGYVMGQDDEEEEGEESAEEVEAEPIHSSSTKQTNSTKSTGAASSQSYLAKSAMASTNQTSLAKSAMASTNQTSLAKSTTAITNQTTSSIKSQVASGARKMSSSSNQSKTSTGNSLATPRSSIIPSQSVSSPPNSQQPSERRRFEGKVAIVTESNCGIDRATAVLLGKEGAKVTIHGTDEDELRRTIIRMMRVDIDQDDILVVQGAIENDETLNNLVERTIKKFGHIDILINNAGKIIHSSNNPSHRHNGGGEEEEDDDSVSSEGNKRLNRYNRRRSTYQRNSMYDDSQNFDLLFNINLRSITKLTRLCLPYLEDTNGAVVNVTSFGSQQAFSDYANYSTAKTALDNYCRSIAIKYAKRNIRVNNVNPGFITCESAEDTEVHVNKFYLSWIKNHVPMGRGGTAEEIAKVIGFLASEDASYITGATIVADGAVSIFSKPPDFF